MDRYNLILTDQSFVIEESKLLDILGHLGMDKKCFESKNM